MSDDLMAYYASLIKSEAKSENDLFDEDINIKKLMPRIRMSRTVEQFEIFMGDEVIETTKFIRVIVMARRASRSLWAPHGVEHKTPLCSTGWLQSAKGTHGKWLAGEEYTVPESTECASCPYNEYGSAGLIDEKKVDAKGKACGETRTYFLLRSKRVISLREAILRQDPKADVRTVDEEFSLFEPDVEWTSGANPHAIALMDLSMGSNKSAIESIPLQVRAHGKGKLPMEGAVFEFRVKHVTRGAVTLAILEPKLVGIVSPEVHRQIHNECLPWINEFATNDIQLQEPVEAF